ncbi:MAG: sigma-54 dependent transcriptional regulator [Pseudomonadota bacterium]
MSESNPPLLLVDDDPLILETLSFALAPDFEVFEADSRQDVRELLQSSDVQPMLALVDLGLPPKPHTPEEGFALITELLAFNRAIKVLVLSGQDERGNIQHALTLGAVDFIGKPCDPDFLRSRLNHQAMLLEAEQQLTAQPKGIDAVLLGESPGMRTLRSLVAQFADNPFPVLVEGESGSGKELVAQCLHQASERQEKPILTINCAAFSAELLEAQLFGHAKGAFTGADRARAGFFEESSEGTLFLDEVGEMPLELQSKFLRVLENGEYYRVGETQPRRSSARIVAATNRDLRESVRSGAFRQDLYHRLSVLTISVPPLRTRGSDWQLLAQRFQENYAEMLTAFRFNAEAIEELDRYGFPGNVRELRNIVIRLGAKYPGADVDAEAVRQELELDFEPPAEGSELGVLDIEGRIRAEGFRLDDELMELEKRFVAAALKLGGGNLSQAARLLGVNRTTLYSRANKLGITGEE